MAVGLQSPTGILDLFCFVCYDCVVHPFRLWYVHYEFADDDNDAIIIIIGKFVVDLPQSDDIFSR